MRAEPGGVPAAGREAPAPGDPDAALDRDAAPGARRPGWYSGCRKLVQLDPETLRKTGATGISDSDGPILCEALDPA